MARKLTEGGPWAACYDAGPTGYTLYWQLTKAGIPCVVIAPSLVPTKAGDRVKSDRRDAQRLASSFRAGELSPVWVPDAAHEALRDLVRAREAAKQDLLRARHRLGKYLLLSSNALFPIGDGPQVPHRRFSLGNRSRDAIRMDVQPYKTPYSCDSLIVALRYFHPIAAQPTILRSGRSLHVD